ncbi:hypothetical protein EDD37DRAFT_605693 [Exophiala viscosa]|uniref:Uncharacterized protein n=1 Tax=Exophiala viscosa TaxID=2486360 RepID=A0AAN6IJP4_9EURO|nr:hypothetical protein EDD36DRAFT_413440 [Exophiala viscosa]KAI1626860.1 hypothetical protein EDD37DRAFT_605693 [Exophiala viscosa]
MPTDTTNHALVCRRLAVQQASPQDVRDSLLMGVCLIFRYLLPILRRSPDAFGGWLFIRQRCVHWPDTVENRRVRKFISDLEWTIRRTLPDQRLWAHPGTGTWVTDPVKDALPHPGFWHSAGTTKEGHSEAELYSADMTNLIKSCPRIDSDLVGLKYALPLSQPCRGTTTKDRNTKLQDKNCLGRTCGCADQMTTPNSRMLSPFVCGKALYRKIHNMINDISKESAKLWIWRQQNHFKAADTSGQHEQNVLECDAVAADVQVPGQPREMGGKDDVSRLMPTWCGPDTSQNTFRVNKMIDRRHPCLSSRGPQRLGRLSQSRISIWELR